MARSHTLLFILFLIASVGGCNSAADNTSNDGNTNPTPEPDQNPKPSRVSEGLVLLYSFNDGNGTVISDSSGHEPQLDAEITTGSDVWIDGGLHLNVPTEIVTPGPADKLTESISASNAFTLEAWIKPENIVQEGPARIVSLSGNTTTQSFMLGQQADAFHVRLRTSSTEAKGLPALASPPGSATTELTHLVFTWAARDGQDAPQADLYVNGQWSSSIARQGSIGWENHPLRIGYERASSGFGTDYWLGEYYLFAVYDRKLTESQIQQNYKAGSE
jgi:hypothetical protein